MIRFHFLNVDNGDCTIIEHAEGPNRSFGLIDCNRTPTRRSPALEKLIALGADELEFVCITHPDKDHYSGISDVLHHYEGKIKTFMTFPLASLLTDRERLKKYAQKILALADLSDDEDIASRHLELVEILKFASDTFLPDNWIDISGDRDRIGLAGFNGVEFYGIAPPRRVRGQITSMVLNPEAISTVDNNDISVALEILYAGRRIVLGGDSTDANWSWHRSFRQKIGATISSDLVKLPHHGSTGDNSKATLDDFFQGQPNSIAIISASGRSHPDGETIDALNSLSCTRLCTNLFNPNEQALKRIYNNAELTTRFRHYLNVYSTPAVVRPQPCKGDITVEIRADGSISTSTEFNSICGCSILSSNGAPLLPSAPAI